jgi:hypothetical protein
MAIGFKPKPSGNQLTSQVEQLVRLGKRTFPVDLMRHFGLMLDGEQVGPSEDYGVAFLGHPQINVATYKAAPRGLRAAICFDEMWDYIDPALSSSQAFELIKAFTITSSELASEAMEAIDD